MIDLQFTAAGAPIVRLTIEQLDDDTRVGVFEVTARESKKPDFRFRIVHVIDDGEAPLVVKAAEQAREIGWPGPRAALRDGKVKWAHHGPNLWAARWEGRDT